ncbi:MAG: tetratricopeptide repeat protein, partial [Flavobacteriaceae bacterium]
GALAIDPEATQLYDDTLILALASGHEEEAAKLATRRVKLDGRNRLARLLLGVRSFRARQYAEARKHLAELDGSPLSELTAGLLSAWTYLGAGDAKGAAEALKGIDASSSEELAKLKAYHAGLIAEMTGDKAGAEAQFAVAYDTDGKVLRVVQSYARALAANGKTEEARKVLDSFDSVLPGHPLIVAERAEIDAGRAPASDIISPQDGAAEVFYGLGSALGRDAADRLGTIYLQLATMLDSDFPLALITLASHFEEDGNYAEAITIYDRVSQKSPLWLSTQIARARDLGDLERADEAVEVLSKLTEQNPGSAEAPVALGDILRDQKRYAEAVRAYTQGIARSAPIEQKDWVLFYFRGMSNERAKDWPSAEADLQRALELQPDHPFVLNYLGYSWVDQGLHLEKALEMIKRAVELRPNDGYIVDSLGWAYYRLGRYDEAAEELERAVKLRPQDPILNDHLGDAYWRAGRRTEARFQWNHARDLGPEAADLPKILDKIENGLAELEQTSRAASAGNGG